MIHLDDHPHAFLINNIVSLVATFESHDENLIEVVRVANGMELAVCCCNQQIVPAIGWGWDGVSFIEPKVVYTLEDIEYFRANPGSNDQAVAEWDANHVI